MGGGTDVQNTTQTQSVNQLPPWINQAAQQNYAFAQNAANQPLQQFQGQEVANIGPQMQQAWNLAAGGGAAGQDQYNASQAAYLASLGQTPQQVTPQTLRGTNLQPYMNPFAQSVINRTLPLMQQQLGQQQSQIGAGAATNNAWGGSRMGVEQGVAQAQGALNMGQMAAQLNQANFGQAQAAATGDITRGLQAQQLNQAAQQNQGALNLSAAGGLGALGQQAQLSQARNYEELMGAGALEQQQAQNQINANIANFQQAWQYPYQQLSVLQSALGMTPYETAQQGTSISQQQSSPNWGAFALNALQGVGSLFSAPAGGMSAAGGLANFFSGVSDRKLKTDIAKVGRHPAGVDLYSYRYKGDPKTYPKIVGPMAEDVAKIAPHAVATIPGSGGKRAVNMGALNALGGPPGSSPVMGPRVNPPGVAPGVPRLPQPSMAAGPMVPGALSSPGVMGGIGALGGAMRGQPRLSARRPRPIPMRGALGG